MRRSLYGLLAAQAISVTGSRMSMLALPWFVLVTTQSAVMTGVVAFAEMAPYVLACALGGPLLDRVGMRRASIVCDVASVLAVAAVPWLGNQAALIAVVALAGGLRGLGDISKRVMFPRAVKDAGMDMTRGASLADGSQRLASLIGAPVAGVLIAAFDAKMVILIDAGTFLVGALLIAAFVKVRTEPQPHEPYFAALRGGLAFLRSDRLLAALLLMFFVTNLLDNGYYAVLAPIWAKELGSPVALGILGGAFSLGAVLGNIVFTAVAPRIPRYAFFVVGFLIMGAPRYVATAFAEQLWPLYVITFVAGLSAATINPISGAVFLERVPSHMQARVQGLATALGYAGIPLGALLAGFAAEGMNVTWALLLFGAVYLVATLQPLLWPAWKNLSVRIPAQAGERDSLASTSAASVSRD